MFGKYSFYSKLKTKMKDKGGPWMIILDMKKSFKFLLVIIAMILLLVMSEIVHGNNVPNVISYTYFKMAQVTAKSGDLQKTLNLLATGADLNTRLTKKRGRIGEFFFQRLDNNNKLDIIFYDFPGEIKLRDNSQFKKEVLDYVANFPSELFLNTKYDFARVFYDLGVIAYRNHEEYLFPTFLKTSINLRTDQSNWYLELANFYYRYEQDDDAKYILLICKSISTNKDFCQDISSRIEKHDYPLETGFLLEETAKNYDYPGRIK